MRLAFLGTPDIAAACLRAVAAAGHEVAAVYAQPPAPRGRGQALRPSPVQALADALSLPVRTPASMRDPAEVEAFQALGLDAAVVVAYGQILPREVLEAPRLGAFNLHASLLPRWRGAAPIQRAIMAGDAETGVQVMRMTEGLDEGPILSTARLAIGPDETAGTLHDRMAKVGADLLAATLADIAAGRAIETPQADEGATYAKKISARTARLRWTRPAAELDCKIRGLSPFPGAWFEAPGPRGPVRVKALLSRAEAGSGAPGEVLDDALLVATGESAVRLLRLQREGRGPQDAADFLRGLPLPAGTQLA
ncbi:methionyl-tRNA formyltransferase [Phenylobacterium sp.]|uniref:methionyl-tRNA formyltransferase n=1 Tax=Phenylobacterium sp. TaxID=1871053 RepID=UPI0025EB500B|nr:methionyl-tRNA formyltransferase [Phenylobacterium sp.]MCA6285616.1 methionyl-tRNA formyltransferase [Phenylobacterium sp.]MCA6287642.1 methionyl-tRNA formyltransferase [Phenylobacterium sp.]MCA6310565.1 methionyl-tRNA formyltransferase [Phenylobacterium sp.]MCA6324277.1 methionyl-tRNA formyltransferase [Phenylobacterium sp.]MCA6337806.1 methionyl-tRNA formyltransferase [Phenylobacterium sp.]